MFSLVCFRYHQLRAKRKVMRITSLERVVQLVRGDGWWMLKNMLKTEETTLIFTSLASMCVGAPLMEFLFLTRFQLLILNGHLTVSFQVNILESS